MSFPRACSGAFAITLPLFILAAMVPHDVRAQSRTATVRSTSVIAALATPATVTIVTLNASGDTVAQGSGFIVRPDGTLITNWHVMRGASDAVVQLPSQERFTRVMVLAEDSAADLAILRIAGAGLPTLRTRNTVPAVGTKVIAIGSPMGLSRTVTEGIVSAVRVEDGRELVQISAAISHGSSGGAVLDATGAAFAISSSSLRNGQQLNFAIPVRYALGLLAVSGVPRQIGEVFARGNLRHANESESPYKPAATAIARTSPEGVYRLSQMYTPASGAAGKLLTGELAVDRDVGVVRVKWVGTADDTTQTIFASLRTTLDGTVILREGSDTLTGQQTARGFTASMSKQNTWTAYTVKVSASRIDPLTSPTVARFRLSTTTTYTARGVVSSRTGYWTGRVAIALADRFVLMDLVL